jgi:hypothetical protein
MKRVLPFLCLLGLSACGIFEGDGDEIVFDTALGPRTVAQVKTLPGTLEGDSAAARHSNEDLPGEHMSSADGTDD